MIKNKYSRVLKDYPLYSEISSKHRSLYVEKQPVQKDEGGFLTEYAGTTMNKKKSFEMQPLLEEGRATI
jgi:hypothetical protein